MNKITNYTFALCIALAASTTQSLETDSSSATSIIRATSTLFHPIECAQNFLRAKVDSTLSLEIENARTYYTQILDILTNVDEFGDGILFTIQEKSQSFGTTLGSEETENEKRREIFAKWVQSGLDLRKKYVARRLANIRAAAGNLVIIFEMHRKFDVLRSYKDELENCRSAGNLLRWMIPVTRCTASCGFKILTSIFVIKENMPIYEISAKNIETLLGEIKEGENCLNFANEVPADLRDFHTKSLSF